MRGQIVNFLKKYVAGSAIFLVKKIFKLLKIIYFDYVLRLFNTCFDTLVIIAEKFSSTVFLLCLVVTIVFCIDFGHAEYRTYIVFQKSGGLKVSPLLVDLTVYVTTVATYGAKSILRKFAETKKVAKTILPKEEEGED